MIKQTKNPKTKQTKPPFQPKQSKREKGLVWLTIQVSLLLRKARWQMVKQLVTPHPVRGTDEGTYTA